MRGRPRANDEVVFAKKGDQPKRRGRAMLAVGVHDQDVLTGRLADAALDRSTIALVVGVTRNPRTGSFCRCCRRIAGSIVNDDDFVPRGACAKRGHHRLDGGSLVVRRNDYRDRGGVSQRRLLYVAWRKFITSPSCTTYSLPSRRTSACSRHAASDPRCSSGSQATTSARMKPRWISLWISPAASWALVPLGMDHARFSSSPTVKNEMYPSRS